MGNGCASKNISQFSIINTPSIQSHKSSLQFQHIPRSLSNSESDSQSGSEEEPQKYIGAIRNVATTGGFIFEVKRYESIKDPSNPHSSLKHLTSPTLNTFDKQSTNMNSMMRMTTLGPSPEQIQHQKEQIKELEDETNPPQEIALPQEKQLLQIPNNGMDLMKMKTPNWGELDREGFGNKKALCKNNSNSTDMKNRLSINSQHGHDVKEEADEKAVELSIKKPKIKAAGSKKHSLKPIFQNKSAVVKGTENDLIFQNQELMNISKIDEMPSLTSSTSFLFGLDKKFMASNNTPDLECSAIEKLEVGV